MNANEPQTCANCFFATPDMIPDPNFIWGADGNKKTKVKPKITGFRCHVSKPTINGFPAMTEDDFCPFYTTKDEKHRQPLRRLGHSAATFTIGMREG